MTRRRLFGLNCMAAAMLVASVGSNSTEASIALRLVASSGVAPDQAYYLDITPGDPLNETFSKNLSIGGYSVIATLQTTNFPGDPSNGSLTLQATTSTGSAAPDDLTLTGSVIDSTGLSGASTVAQIKAASLASFTLPTGPANKLTLGNSAVSNSTISSGTLTGTASYSGTDVLSFGGNLTGFSTTKSIGGLASSPYTLSVTQLISGLNANAQGEVTQSTISISAVPEPSTVVLALAGLPILGACWIRRRRAQV